jgi:hypothetical protein
MDRIKKGWINGIFLAVTLAFNTLGAIGVINGHSQKQVSDMFVTLITPSPATFSIWGVIYSFLIISIIAMIVKQKEQYYQKAVDKISVLFWVSCILNMAWIVTCSYVHIELSVLFILAFVITLSLICMSLLKLQEGKRWLLPLSFGLYSGWLFIATVVNISAALVKSGWNRFGIADQIWAAIILIIAVLLVIGVMMKNRNAAFPLPVALAYFGIYQNFKSQAGFIGEYGLLQAVSLAGMVVFLCAAAIQFYRNHFSLQPSLSIDRR